MRDDQGVEYLKPVAENNCHLKMFTEAVIIISQFASDDDQCNTRVVNTKALLHALFERSEVVGDHYKAIVQAQSANDW